MRTGWVRVGALMALAALLPVAPAHALSFKKKAAPAAPGKSTPPEEALKSYIERVRAQ